MENVCSLRLCPVSPAVAVAGMPRTVPTLPSVKLYLGAVVSSKQDNQFLFLLFGVCMPIDLYARKIVVHSLPSSGVFAFSPPSQGRPLLLPSSQHLRQHGFRWPAPTRCPDVRLFQLLALRRSVPRVMSSSMFVWQCWTLSVDYHVAKPATDPAPWMTAPSSVGRHTGSPHGTGSACFDEAARRQLCPRATLPMLAAGPWKGDGCPWTL